MPTTAERLCRVMKTDRLHPVYTMCQNTMGSTERFLAYDEL
ncbi:MAG: hypothetical protein V8S42_08445 [Lachnospiraceae bacterium]